MADDQDDPGPHAAPDASVPVRYRTIHGHRRAYRLLGEGPALLLLHGIGDSSQGWEPLMAPLAEHFTVIAPDLLGHGESAKPRADYSVAAYANGMRDLLDVLEVDHATVVGHSLGGGVAAQFAYQYPERCDRLVLVATGGVGAEVHPALRLATLPLADLVLAPMQLPPARFAGRVGLRLLRASGTDLGRDADELQRVFDGLPDGAARGAFSRTLRSVVDWRGQVVTMRDRAYLTRDVPTMVVWGGHDAVIPAAHAELVAAALPEARIELFDEAGHFPHHHDPERFVALIEEFVHGTEAAAHDPELRRHRLRHPGDAPTASAALDGDDPPQLSLVG
jgi:pimeloyl-ACP methyl ester carboxylesterase